MNYISPLMPHPIIPGMDFTIQEVRQPTLLAVSFADNYMQECQDGISGEKQTTVTVTWVFLTRMLKETLDTFYHTLAGAGRFPFTLPGGSSKVYVCKTWLPQEISYNNWTLQATWDRVPDSDPT